MAKSITADDVMRKWAENGSNSMATVRAGVNAVTESPMAKAAQRADAWVAGVQKAKEKFITKLNAVTLQDWKQAMLGKGITNMGNGYADAGNQRKYLAFMRVFLPYVRQGAAEVRRMPKGGGIQQSIDRAAAMIRWNAGFRNQLPVAPMPRAGGG